MKDVFYTLSNRICTVNNVALKHSLPPLRNNAIRVRTSDGNAPIRTMMTYYNFADLVQGTTDIYDVYNHDYRATDFAQFLALSTNVIEVLEINVTDSPIDVQYMFQGTNIQNLPVFNTSATKYFNAMFGACSALTAVPLFDTRSALTVAEMFYDCKNVETGTLALYQQMSTQQTIPDQYYDCFHNCGVNTVQGAAELAQIPAAWK